MNSAFLYIRHCLAFPVTLPMMGSLYLLSLIHIKLLPKWTAWINPFFYLFVIVDVLYNLIFGTWFFLEWPKELLFTTRVQRHVDEGDPHAVFLGHVLNRLDPNHIKRLPY